MSITGPLSILTDRQSESRELNCQSPPRVLDHARLIQSCPRCLRLQCIAQVTWHDPTRPIGPHFKQLVPQTYPLVRSSRIFQLSSPPTPTKFIFLFIYFISTEFFFYILNLIVLYLLSF